MSGSAIKPDLPDVTRPRQELLEQVELKMAIGDELRMQTEPNPYEVAVCGQFDIPFKRLRGRRNRQGRYALAIAGRTRSREVGIEVEMRMELHVVSPHDHPPVRARTPSTRAATSRTPLRN